MNKARIQMLYKDLLEELGYDPTSESLKDTPRRVSDYWDEFINYDAGKYNTTFSSVKTNQMVVVKGMRVWSMCEHHLIPFWCDVSIAYITREKVLGLSKFGRIAQLHAHKLQLQERLVEQIAEDIIKIAETSDVAVLAEGEHLCMTSRGIGMPARMISSSLHGSFKESPETRAEFMSLVKG